MADKMNDQELYQLFERLQNCVDQMRVMQNLQEKEHHNLYRSIVKLDKQVSYLASQLSAGIPTKKAAPAGKRRPAGGSGDNAKKQSRPAPSGDEREDEKRPSTGEDLSSNETDSSHAEPGEHSPRGRKGRRSERRSRRHRRAKRASEGRAQPASSGLSDEPLVPTWTGPPADTFAALQLKPDLMTGIQASPSGASEPTPFQRKVLPALLQDADVVVQARGIGADDGKQAAVALAVLNKVNPTLRACQALVLTSSRDAAKQLHRELVGLATFIKPRLTCHLSIGGTSVRDDLRDMSAGCHLVVGTLGRAFDMLRRGALKAAELRMVVLDDVDTMMTRRFDKDHIYAVLGDVTAEVQERLQVMLFLSLMHEDIPKMITLFAKAPVTQVLVEAPPPPSGAKDALGKTADAVEGTIKNPGLEDAVMKLAEKLGEMSMPVPVPEIVLTQPPMPEAIAQGVVEG
ncbi:ATP-dependent RNA helicase eIF4A [Amphibalanus amphitrite]|uniref:ATP-dependent RNA helicase n=1 Tax=Amphibalanus amphitrite TaxID=1232801 RepID=A0A6A4W538_AMPAM|nr:ATP-dependent RNA helicase eIF4A [Amphibalanus amphitrite]